MDDGPDGHRLTGVGLGAPWTEGDPALQVFPERAPATRRWCFADQLGPHTPLARAELYDAAIQHAPTAPTTDCSA